ncbi:hypothetical protein DV737_g3257, partial [Chaetothyriales sp. CBS 132003]
MPSAEKEEQEGPRRMLHKRPSRLRRLSWKVVDAYDNTNWLHIAFKVFAYTYIALNLWVAWQILPLAGHWDPPVQSDKVPFVYQDHSNYFGSFNGVAECGIEANDLYEPAQHHKSGQADHGVFCANRKSLLRAMSEGGRVGFDAPYTPKDCSYRWYTVEEMCFILHRFDAIVFVGDSFLQSVYSGFNILLRRDLASGAMKMDLDNCRCDLQFINPDCKRELVHSSEDAGGFWCKPKPHALLALHTFPAPADTITKFKKLVPYAPRSRYQPIAIIHSISPSTMPHDVASQSLVEFLNLADQSKRKTPMLWIGPIAPGHIDIKNRKGNQEIWDFDTNMAKVASQNDIDVLHMWNLTVQATSHDGLHFGEKVAITQAMMVINWLSRLPSS